MFYTIKVPLEINGKVNLVRSNITLLVRSSTVLLLRTYISLLVRKCTALIVRSSDTYPIYVMHNKVVLDVQLCSDVVPLPSQALSAYVLHFSDLTVEECVSNLPNTDSFLRYMSNRELCKK